MNYNTAFVIAARTAEVHDTVQRWIRNEAPVIEERIKRTALHAAIAFLEFIVAVIDWAQGHIERSPEYRLQFQIAKIRVYRYCIRQAIKVEKARLQYAPKVTRTLDKVFCLD